jgi:hypothetical protein
MELASSLHPKLLRPQPIHSGMPFHLIPGLEAVLDHLINLRELDPEDLRQDLPGCIQLHSSPVLRRRLLWPEKLLKNSGHSGLILRAKLSTFAGKQYQ